MRSKNIINQKFFMLTPIEFLGRIKNHSVWKCLCDCGNIKITNYSNLVSGNTKSCGCYNTKCIKERANKIITDRLATKEKRCPVCKIIKKTDDFYPNKSRKDKLHSICKQCCSHNGKTIQARMRTRIGIAIKNQNTRKNSSTMKMVDCELIELKNHLQQTATDNGYTDFNINNYSGKEYHIDHIIPCDAFNLSCSYHQKLCFNWSNLQILKAETNLSKHNKYNIEIEVK